MHVQVIVGSFRAFSFQNIATSCRKTALVTKWRSSGIGVSTFWTRGLHF